LISLKIIEELLKMPGISS